MVEKQQVGKMSGGDGLGLALGLLGCTAGGSLLFLLLLCRLKTIRGRATSCVQRIKSHRSDIELLSPSDQLNSKCVTLIQLCDSLQIHKGRLSTLDDISQVHRVVEIATSITEETSLLDCRLEVLKEMSRSLASLEERLGSAHS